MDHEHAIEGRVQSGSIQLGQGTGTIVFDMRSFAADTKAARQYLRMSGTTDASTRQKVQANMVGQDVLNVQRYPTATMTIESIAVKTSADAQAPPAYEITGIFELHGAKRRITFQANAQEKNGWTNLTGRFDIQQTAFGITPFSKAFGVIGIADRLTIHGNLWLAGTPTQLAERTNTRR